MIYNFSVGLATLRIILRVLSPGEHRWEYEPVRASSHLADSLWFMGRAAGCLSCQRSNCPRAATRTSPSDFSQHWCGRLQNSHTLSVVSWVRSGRLPLAALISANFRKISTETTFDSVDSSSTSTYEFRQLVSHAGGVRGYFSPYEQDCHREHRWS